MITQKVTWLSNLLCGIKNVELKDIHKEKTPSNKTPMLSESINRNIWVNSTSNQLLIRSS